MALDGSSLFEDRAAYSIAKLKQLNSSLANAPAVDAFPEIAIFCAGSYARHEASEHSDIDPFFITTQDRNYFNEEYRVPKIRMMSEIISIGDRLNFPKFSNDGQFLRVLHLPDILAHLGGDEDDYRNYFTSRLLLILESRPLYGEEIYKRVLDEVLESYFRDYPSHTDDFHVRFLLNDIVRFWKTLCLNYENRRNNRASTESEKVKRKVRNFKLKFSRLLTCYASIAYLSSLETPVTKTDVVAMTQLTPMQRLDAVAKRVPDIEPFVQRATDEYRWFLAQTGQSAPDLHQCFADKGFRADAFNRAERFGDEIFKVLSEIDKTSSVFRHLVI